MDPTAGAHRSRLAVDSNPSRVFPPAWTSPAQEKKVDGKESLSKSGTVVIEHKVSDVIKHIFSCVISFIFPMHE